MDVIYAMVYEDTGDVVGTYPSRVLAEDSLAEFIAKHPHVQDEVGLRPYAQGRPAGDYESALDVLGDRLAQQHLA